MINNIDEIINAYKCNDTIRLDNYLSSDVPIEYHYIAEEWNNDGFRDYLFSHMMSNLDKVNLSTIVTWAQNIRSHLEELVEVVLSWVSPERFYSGSVHDLMVAHWLLDVDYKSVDVKIKAINENLAEQLIDALIFVCRTMSNVYSPYDSNKFYSDLPLEYQLGIII